MGVFDASLNGLRSIAGSATVVMASLRDLWFAFHFFRFSFLFPYKSYTRRDSDMRIA